MYDLANESDEELVHLEIGEPDFDTADHIIESAFEAAKAGATHYTANAGLLELRKLIAERTSAPNYRPDPKTQVTVTSGAMEALYLSLLSVVDPGDEVIIPTPAWPNYRNQTLMVGGNPVEVPLSASEGFSLDVPAVIEAMTDDTAAVILTTPSNPTGQVYDEEPVRQIIEAAAENNTYVIADEVYEGLVYGQQPTGVAGYTDRSEYVLSLSSCSKMYAMTGWRVGWLVGPEDVINVATKLHENTSACASSVSQHAAIAALSGPQTEAQRMKECFKKRRDYVVDRIEATPNIDAPTPDGAIYAFLDVSAVEGSSVDIARRLLTEYNVVTAPGQGFGSGGEDHLRISFANSLDRIEYGFDQIETMVE